VLDPASAELVATQDDTAGADAEYDRITHSLYVTEQRTFFLVERFFAFDGRPASSTKPLSLQQARAWCAACGLHERTIDRYVMHAPDAKGTPQVASLLTQRWGMQTSGDASVA
jgi:hypothetical protein